MLRSSGDIVTARFECLFTSRIEMMAFYEANRHEWDVHNLQFAVDKPMKAGVH